MRVQDRMCMKRALVAPRMPLVQGPPSPAAVATAAATAVAATTTVAAATTAAAGALQFSGRGEGEG